VNIELHEPRENSKRIVPYTTPSGLQIGRCWTPKQTATYASPGSYCRPSERNWMWIVFLIGVVGLVLAGVTR
jgi:hypothetical protein